jgi:hypothetical protein
MNKKGFLLIECISALAILISLTGSYAWYFWHNLALQVNGMRQLTYTTSLSNASEQLIAHAMLAKSDNNTQPQITYHTIEPLPPMTGLWASIPMTIPYVIYELSADINSACNKQGTLTWYIGCIARD